MHPAGVLDHAEQNFPAGVPVARIAQDDGGAEIWIERAGHLAFAVCASAGDYEGDTAAFEVLAGREKIFKPTGVGEDDGNSSVRGGLVSLTAPTSVVFPTPEPPATMSSARERHSPPPPRMCCQCAR